MSLEALELPVMTEDQNKELSAGITERELDEAIRRLKTNKSPGSDGFITEWYKAFRKELMPMLRTTCNWALKKADIPLIWTSFQVGWMSAFLGPNCMELLYLCI